MSKILTGMIYIADYEQELNTLPSIGDIEKTCYVAPHIARHYLRQYKIFCYIDQFIKQQKYAPSLREIAMTFSLSLSVVSGLVQRLAQEGYIGFTPEIARSLRIIKYPNQSLQQIEG